ncbi:MAG TPA: methionine--tRNA ligase, partial [Thermopetrobacter sp.]|nr:methionine--tRNA ligase [Thermopetrobacter sp.]
PASGAALLDRVGAGAEERDFAHLGEAGRLPPGREIEKPTPVFPRYVEKERGSS